VLREGRAARIDAGRVSFRNKKGADESRFFVNAASCGLGGEVVRRAGEKGEGARWIPTRAGGLLGGRAAYAGAAVRASLDYESPLVRLSVDGGTESSFRATLLCVANGRYFGGGMKIAPEAKLADGHLDLIAVADLDAAGVFTNAHRLYLGTHLGMREVSHARARRVTARAADETARVLLEVDGEFVGMLPATFEILPHALRVRVPA
jgi:diacylglycerol kinase family enzyme